MGLCWRFWKLQFFAETYDAVWFKTRLQSNCDRSESSIQEASIRRIDRRIISCNPSNRSRIGVFCLCCHFEKLQKLLLQFVLRPSLQSNCDRSESSVLSDCLRSIESVIIIGSATDQLQSPSNRSRIEVCASVATSKNYRNYRIFCCSLF
jgi:hypothetical protein